MVKRVKLNENHSDIDIPVETENLPPEEKCACLIDLWEDLEKLFNRKVDLLTESAENSHCHAEK